MLIVFILLNGLNKRDYLPQVFESTEELDNGVTAFAENLCSYNPKAMTEMKTMFWRGTEDWDQLLIQRAKISGRLVLSEFTKDTLRKYK